jgi:hypothetical protein
LAAAPVLGEYILCSYIKKTPQKVYEKVNKNMSA